MIEETGCDAVMIGRAAMGQPWIFSPDRPEPDLILRLSALSRHLELINIYCETGWGLAGIKNHAGRYFKGIPHGASIRQQIYACQSFSELENLTSSLKKEASY